MVCNRHCYPLVSMYFNIHLGPHKWCLFDLNHGNELKYSKQLLMQVHLMCDHIAQDWVCHTMHFAYEPQTHWAIVHKVIYYSPAPWYLQL